MGTDDDTATQRLTDAQRVALRTIAARQWPVETHALRRLETLGLIDWLGMAGRYVVTDAGRAALRESEARHE